MRVATIEVKEIPWEPTWPPQVFCTVVQHGDEFDMLEEVEPRAKVKRLRANLSAMMA